MNSGVKTILLLVYIALAINTAQATNYYSDPANGNMSNDGLSQTSAWGSLKAIFEASKTFHSGDSIFLMSGAHGEVYISGTNTDYVCVVGLESQTPKIASILLQNASYWEFKDITFITDGTAGSFSRTHMFRTSTNADHIRVNNCTFYSSESSSSWSKADWYNYAKDAVLMEGNYSNFQNNTLKNIYFAVEIRGDNSIISNNLIDNFGADAIRVLGSSIACENNTIRDAYIEDYGTNHDDAIQMYNYNDITNGLNSNIIIRNNMILQFADTITQAMLDDNLVGYSMQGIIITDGHIENSIIENNLVVSDHYHGITLVGAQNCRIQNNTVLKTPTSTNPTTNAIPWIQYGDDKNGNQSINNIIRNNLTTKLTPWTYPDAQNTTQNNMEIASNDYVNYFVNAINFNFRLKAQSPAIDAGINLNLTNTDLAGNPRLIGSLPDCGAYEFQGTNTAPILNPIGNQMLNEGETKDVALSATDADGNALTFSASGNPSWAKLTDNGDGTAKLTLAPQTGDSGTYDNIIVTVSDGIDEDSELIKIEVSPSTGISIMANDEIQIYPNPSIKGRFTINLSGKNLNAELQIYSINGSLVYHKLLNKPIERINANLKPDIYIIHLYTKGKEYYKKMVVN